ncbi:MAG: protein kinase, partial [Desulfobacterales bacterium]|nr:protein kinase [Desulfobacterales bacterium]
RQEEYDSELQRFRREVQVMARIRHPNVLQVYDFDQIQMDDKSLDYIVMEYVPGPTLRQTMLVEGFREDEGAAALWINKYFLPVLWGMEAVHALGVLHRDLKPENVLIDNDIPKIADFGLAGGHQLDDITCSYHILGTVPYMPEEQFLDLGTTDARTDVYSLGKILYEAIDGKMSEGRNKPFKAAYLSSPSTRLLVEFDRVIQNATAKDRTYRTASVSAMREQLVDIIQTSEYANTLPASRKHKKQLFVTAGIAGAVILVLAASFGIHLVNMQSDTATDAQNKSATAVRSENYEFDFKASRYSHLPEIAIGDSLPEEILGSDGMTLRLVSGGETMVAMDQADAPDRKQVVKAEFVPDFYMDETKITNHMYVAFLQDVQGLVVKNKTVRRDGEIWLLLGEVLEGYEPVVYRDGKWKIKPGAASNPVVRITPTGAMAYASYYGRTLPTMAQWWLAVQAGDDEILSDEPGLEGSDPNGAVQDSAPPGDNRIRHVAAFESNRLGIWGLGRNVNEWTIHRPNEQEIEFHVHGGLGELESQKGYLERQAWEAYARVGFRTVANLPQKEQ